MRHWVVRYTGPMEIFVDDAESSIEAEIEASQRYTDNWVATEIEEEDESEMLDTGSSFTHYAQSV